MEASLYWTLRRFAVTLPSESAATLLVCGGNLQWRAAIVVSLVQIAPGLGLAADRMLKQNF